MKIYLSDKLGKGFIFEYVPTFIYKKWLESIKKNKIKVEKVLEENNVTLKDFIKQLKDVFTIKKFGKVYIISTKKNNIDTIIRTIDYGNSLNIPSHIFDKDFNYIRDNLPYIYEMWLDYIKV